MGENTAFDVRNEADALSLIPLGRLQAAGRFMAVLHPTSIGYYRLITPTQI